MEDQKRLFTAIFLIIGFLYVWFGWISPPPSPPKPEMVKKESTAKASPGAAAAQSVATLPTKSLASPSAKMVKETETHAETALVNYTFSNLAGCPRKIDLKKYRTTTSKNSPSVEVFPFMGATEPGLLWQFDLDGTVVEPEAFSTASVLDRSVVYVRNLAPGVVERRTFSWNEGNYIVPMEVELINGGNSLRKVSARLELHSGTVGAETPSMMHPGNPMHLVTYVNEKASRKTPENILKSSDLPKGNVGWAGFESRYFMTAAIPTEGNWLQIRSAAESSAAEGNNKPGHVSRLTFTAEYPVRELPAKASLRYRVNLYSGPKDISILQGIGGSLEKAIDLGDWLGPIARAILKFLRVLHQGIPNYGVAIILLTTLVRLALFPLAHMQAKSMRKMQDHKPELDALKKKYEKDKERYSREMMQYMKTHRINPMGGCLLLLPQMPIFFALYRVLYNSIELRHAPFMLWIHDLSAHDPYFVTPVILGILMFFQQKMTPSPGVDPAQQTMLKIMPVMFSAFMLFLPAGLSLYILISTLWGVGQQYWVKKGMRTGASLKVGVGSD